MKDVQNLYKENFGILWDIKKKILKDLQSLWIGTQWYNGKNVPQINPEIQ